MLESLPEEVFFEILSRLPVKEIIRSRCVSKTWSSLICSPKFIATHLNRSLSNPEHSPYLLLCCIDDKLRDVRFTLHSSDAPFSDNNFTELRSSLEKTDWFWSVAGSSNGVLCLVTSFWGPHCGSDSGPYVLWNPPIQKALTLPNPDVGRRSCNSYDTSVGFSCNSYETSVGFGYVPKTDDYKLVRLVFCLCDKQYTEHGIAHWIQIYTLRTHAWRTVRVHGPPYYIRRGISAAFLHGATHWPAYIKQHGGKRRRVIVSFDLADEAFREVGMPQSIQKKAYDFAVAVFNGLIAVVQGGNKSPESRTVWVMKEYGMVDSWTKLFDIKMLGHIRIHSFKMLSFQRVIGFNETGEALLEHWEHLFSYEASSQRTVRLDNLQGRTGTFFLDKYVESLVPLNVPDTVQ